MDLDDIQSYLYSLKKLYGLLISDGDSRVTSPHNLDEKARLLLKILLDVAMARVLEFHSEVVVAQEVASNTPLQSDPLEDREIKQPAIVQVMSKIPAKTTSASSKDRSRQTRCSVCQRSIVKKEEIVNSLSEEASNAIKQIESCICALNGASSNTDWPIHLNQVPAQKQSPVSGKSVKAIVGKFESLSQTRRQNSPPMPSQIVRHSRAPPDVGKATNLTSVLQARVMSRMVDKENQDQNQTTLEGTTGQAGSTNPSASSSSFTVPTQKIYSTDAPNRLLVPREMTLLHQMIIRPTFPDHKPIEPTTFPTSDADRTNLKSGGAQKDNTPVAPSKTFLPHDRESHTLNPSSSFSSSGTDQEGSDTDTASEEYSLTGDTESLRSSRGGESEVYSSPWSRRHHQLGPTSCTTGETHLAPHKSRAHHSSPASSCESEEYSLPSRTCPNQVSSGYSSQTAENSSSDSAFDHHRTGRNYSLVGSRSRRMGPTRKFKSSNRKKSDKPARRFKKLKDFIFHHHHHHHHHEDRPAQVGCGRSLCKKNAGKLIHQMNEDEAYREQVAQRLGKSLVHRKNQHGHFRALVEGLLKHIWYSKKSKSGREHFPVSGKIGGKKGVKKLHWWQMLQRQRGVKMAGKPGVKLGLGGKKPLRVVPKRR